MYSTRIWSGMIYHSNSRLKIQCALDFSFQKQSNDELEKGNGRKEQN